MKKFFVLLLVLSVSFSQAQKNKQAIKTTDELSKVMDLSQDEKEKLLVLNTEKFEKLRTIRQKHKGDKEAIKAEAKLVNQEFNKNLRALVGKEKMKLLNAYRKKKNLEKKMINPLACIKAK